MEPNPGFYTLCFKKKGGEKNYGTFYLVSLTHTKQIHMAHVCKCQYLTKIL